MSKNAPASVVDIFYGVSEVAERVEDEAIDQWLAALALLLAEEVGDPNRVVRLAEEALRSVAHPTPTQ